MSAVLDDARAMQRKRSLCALRQAYREPSLIGPAASASRWGGRPWREVLT